MGDKLMRNDTGQAIVTLLREFLNTQQSALESKIGTLSSLTTTAKASLVAAINELVANRGALNGLSTTAKSTIVAAINELVGVDSGHNTRISSLEDKVAIIDTLSNRTEILAPIDWKGYGCLRNSLFRGKNLGPFTATHANAIKYATFDDMYLGDYFTCPDEYKNTAWGDNHFVIAGFNLFDAGGNPYKPNIVVFARTTIKTEAFNTTATTEGGYAASHWRNNVRPQLVEDAQHIFSSHLLSVPNLVPAANSGGKTTGYTSVGNWCCEIPSRSNFGFGNLADNSNFTTPTNRIFPIFNVCGLYLIFYMSYTNTYFLDPASDTKIWGLTSWGKYGTTVSANEATTFNPYLIIGG